jgi:hypothetical protein
MTSRRTSHDDTEHTEHRREYFLLAQPGITLTAVLEFAFETAPAEQCDLSGFRLLYICCARNPMRRTSVHQQAWKIARLDEAYSVFETREPVLAI